MKYGGDSLRAFVRAGVFTVCCAVLLIQSGCIFAPAIDSFRRAGLTSSDRMRLLGERIKEFQEALYWGDPDMALGYVDNEKREELRGAIESASSDEKVTESKVTSTKFDDSAFKADVRIKVRSYKIPYYVVNERIDEETWSYDMTAGWLLTGFKRGV